MKGLRVQKRGAGLWLSLVTVGVVGLGVLGRSTQAASQDFALQVTPSPLVTIVKPGQTTELELKIRNAGRQTEQLKIELRSFTFNNSTEQVQLSDNAPPDIKDWVSVNAPKFSVAAGQWTTEEVRISLPKDAGFSYAFALLISRQAEQQPVDGGRLIKGAVAVFTLVNVDRPDASRRLTTGSFVSTKHVYEYLPATLQVRLKNTGNTIVQPYGNVFVQRGDQATTPLATLPVNAGKSYILPDTTRTFTANWTDGFPAPQTVTNADGTTKSHLLWDWGKLSHLRVGRYTAKLVAVYNDGQHDVPLEATVTFWLFPWKILLGLLVIVSLLLLGLWSLVRKIMRLSGRVRTKLRPPKS